ncbi:MAG: histidine phosphatase family protein [Anaerolineae bacterium]|nr:histidine phosphatase family protein [Anaerolineae bacterium]
MKTLILVRHAKSSWKHPGLPDRLRPLNKRGQHDAPAMGERLAKREIAPDLIISSPATRAMATAEIIAQEIGHPEEEIRADERLYGASAFELLEIIQELDAALEHVMLIGHNPGLTDLANDLGCGIDNLPTCGVVEVRFEIDSWADIGDVDPACVDFDYPKKISR